MVGHDPLNNMMKELSQNEELSNIYTNHCICASIVSTLDEEGYEARHIMHVTSHKSEESLKSYGAKCPQKKKAAIFDTLAQKVPCTGTMLNIQDSSVKLACPPAVPSPATIPKFKYMPGDPDLHGFKGRFYKAPPTAAPPPPDYHQ